jgi:hypothetical protein
LKAELQNPAGEAGAWTYRSDDMGVRTTIVGVLIWAGVANASPKIDIVGQLHMIFSYNYIIIIFVQNTTPSQ